GGNQVKVFSGADLSLLHSFLAYAPKFKGGVRVGAGDINGDRFADILTGPGEGSGTRLRVFSGVDLTLLPDFVVYHNFLPRAQAAAASFSGDPRLRIRAVRQRVPGLQVTTAFIDGDNRADIVTGPGVGGVGNFRVTRAVDNQLISSFLAFEPSYQGGLRVGAIDIITGTAEGGGIRPVVLTGEAGGPGTVGVEPKVTIFDPVSHHTLSAFL